MDDTLAEELTPPNGDEEENEIEVDDDEEIEDEQDDSPEKNGLFISS